jgi:hypothetical protein
VRERVRDLERRVNRVEENLMSEQEQVGTLETAVAQVAADLATATSTLQTELNEFAAANPGVDLTKVTAAVEALDPAVQALAALKPEAPVVEAKPLYVHETDGPTEGWTLADVQEPAVPAVAEVAAIPPDPATGAAEVPAVAAVAEVPAVPLWNFDADVAGGEPTGAAEGIWSVYTGPTEAVPVA